MASLTQQALGHQYLYTKTMTLYWEGRMKYVKAMKCTGKLCL